MEKIVLEADFGVRGSYVHFSDNEQIRYHFCIIIVVQIQ
ncbi:hypothetical protein H4683_001957 [Filibacter limicola]|uniref:Uncharacterized protein n=1 Tax=Sporosarcina limicola TaxID=34101 RepID=A0A927R6D7_9BACL|nr:hypothetical protein [Sporosarcina limicola]